MDHSIPKANALTLRGVIQAFVFAACQTAPLMLAAAALPIRAALAAPTNSETSGMLLAQDFRLAEMHKMPRPSSKPWRFEKRDYSAANAVEWQVRLQGPDHEESPLFEDVRSADFVVTFPADAAVTLHWSKGSHDEPSDFQPRAEVLRNGEVVALESFGGRSSDGVMPYFNLASQGGGLTVAVGWTGDWKASFESLGGRKVRVIAGLKRSRFKLKPGEQVRLPAILVMGYRGDWLDGQNQFRRLMLKEFSPPSHPPLKLLPVAASVHGMIGFNDTTAEKLTALAADIKRANLPLDTFWLDAGWNPGGFPKAQGNPEADPVRFPHGLAPVGAAARKAGLRFLAWFEPERAMHDTWLERERPQWLLRPSGTPPALRYQEKDGFYLLDCGNPQARKWALDSFSRHISEAGIAIYRQDCNLYPAFFWHTDETPDRIGLREIRHITGLYDLLDELTRQHPGLIIDNCASGGRRLDFEILRRSVALWRSDSCWGLPAFPRNVQAMTHGLSLWLPLHGLGAAATDAIALRSGMGGCATFAINYHDDSAVEALRKHLDRFLKVRSLFTADYYPLTPWTLDPGRPLAFQFHDATCGAGIVQYFRGPNTTPAGERLKLRGLNPTTTYSVTNWDAPGADACIAGAELMERGLLVLVRADQEEALVFQYAPVAKPPNDR